MSFANSTRSGVAVLARIAVFAAVVSALAVLLAGPGYRFSILSLGPAIQTMRWGATAAMVTAAIAMLGVALAWKTKARGDLRLALLAVIIGICAALPPLLLYLKVQRLPHIHDISTDRETPPIFVAVVPLRTHASNSMDYPAATAAEQQRGYPDIAPKILKATPAEAFRRAESAAREMGWQIVAIVPTENRIEATDTSLLFGFKDDVVIRVTPRADGSQIDVRSLSRVGGSDFGVNAKRVRDYLKRLATS